MAFAMRYHCEFGQNISILGSSASLGNWDTSQCVDMQWSEDDLWTVEVDLPNSIVGGGGNIEYKYVVKNQDGEIQIWKPGENYMLQIPSEAETERIRICDAWDNSCRNIEVELRSAANVEAKPGTAEEAAEALTSAAEEALEELKSVVESSTAILDEVDPISAEALDADRRVASAADKAMKLTRALNEYRATGQIADFSSDSAVDESR